jgi:Aminopeptidase N
MNQKPKQPFDLAIKYDEKPGETIIANMPEVKNEDGVHYFDTTVRMSTYLIAFAFGDLQSKKTKTKSGVEVGVFATKAHKPNELDFALDIAKRAIEFYEDFYQTPYPLPHSWQLALPDFSAGAMENWGLVTYREAYLMVDPDNTSLDTKQLVATVITHELAHQWFGDLVTMNGGTICG